MRETSNWRALRLALQPCGYPGGKALRDLLADARLAVFGVRVGGEELGLARAAGGLGERLHDADHGARVVARLGHDADAEGVGFELVLAPVAHVDHAADHLADLRGAEVAAADHERAEQPLRELLLREALRGVTPDHVADLVAE